MVTPLERGVIVISFHSSSVDYIEEYFPEVVLSLDAHFDTHAFGITSKLLEAVDKLPKRLRDALLRPSTHALMRRVMPDVEITLVIPLSCLWSDAWGKYDQALRLSGLSRGKMTPKLAVDLHKKFVKEILNIEIFTSPPNSLKKLVKKMGLKKRDTVIDIDIDYMTEFQNECYTTAPKLEIEGVEATKLSSIDKVIKLVKLTRSELITVSEARLESLQKNTSSVNKFFKILRANGYKIEYAEMVSSDEEAYNLIKAHENFVSTKLSEIIKRRITQKKDMFEHVEEEEAKAIEEFFAPYVRKYAGV